MRSARELKTVAVERLTTDSRRPLRQGSFRSPLRDERLAGWLGASLGTLFSICFVTGLYSHIQQHPLSWLPIPAGPTRLFQITQGVHVAVGIACLPLLLAKLWVVWPRLLAFPPFRQVADVVERIGVLALVGGGIFMIFSGVADIAQWYPWRFSFTASHYWIAWVTMGAIVAHLGAKWGIARRVILRPSRRPGLMEADPVLGTVAEVPHDGLTRRQFLGTVAAASGALTVATVGETLPLLRPTAILAPRKASQYPINRSAANAGVIRAATSAEYRLTVTGKVARGLTFRVDELLALPSRRAYLPIACVEGWSYTATWTGVPLGELLRLAGAPHDASARVHSLEQHSIYAVSYVDHFQAADEDTLLATHLDGRRLSLDHGFPLRLIGPNRAGVTQTKWVTKVEVT